MGNVWLCHSCYSFLQGTLHPADVCASAEQLGISGVALTDFDGVYGIVKAWKARKQTSSPTRLFYGTEVLLAPAGSPNNSTPAADLPVFVHDRLAFIARSRAGYEEICRLVTYAYRDGKVATPLSLDDDLVPWPSDCTVILPQRGWAQFCCQADPNSFAAWMAYIANLQSLFAERLSLALTPPTNPFERNAHECHLIAHRNMAVPLVATDDVFFSRPADKPLHDLLTAVRLNLPIADLTWECFPNTERCFHSPAQLQGYFHRSPVLQKAWQNNSLLAENINFDLSELHYRYPSEFVPEGMTSFTFLTQLVWEALAERHGETPPEKLKALLERELQLVAELEYADYFLTVWDVVRFARSQHILCQGRGSAANSAICFVLGITALDPMECDLLFERFISRERGEPPDIDVDFEHERREEVIQYIYNRYGHQRAAMVANVITFRTRGAVRAAGKALGIDEQIITRMGHRFRDRHERHATWFDLLQDGRLALTPAEQTQLSDAHLQTWAHWAEQLSGLPRHLGIHNGGMMISQAPLCAIAPIEPATMTNRYVVQWNKDDIEDLGLFKVDILGLGMLTAVRKCLAILQQRNQRVPGTLIPVRLDTIPHDCPQTYAMIGESRTMGVFQIESRAQMALLPRLKPNRFYDLVISVGIIRPGPIVSGMVKVFMERRTGQAELKLPDERLRPILERTLGVPIFQEQVMRVAMAVANFSPGEADELRRAMGKWQMNGTMDKFAGKLREGMKANNIPDDFAEIIFQQMESFSSYGFPESHAASFAHIAYATAWLKAHFPVEFLCGILNSQPMGFYSIHNLVQNARNEGLTILPPCARNSQWDSTVDKAGRLQLGFHIIKGLLREHLHKFVSERDATNSQAQLPLHQVLSLWQECLFSHEQIILALGGCLAAWETDRRTLLWQVLGNPSPLVDDNDGRRFLFASPTSEDWYNLKRDWDFLKTTLGEHPVALVRRTAWPFSITPTQAKTAQEISLLQKGVRVHCAGLAIIRQSPPTAKGMVFITLEDETGLINLVIRPQIYTRNREKFLQSDLLCVYGKTENVGAQATILVEGAVPLRQR